MHRLCVFSGSSTGHQLEYRETAKDLGCALVRRQIDLVYGGARVGLMGVIADAVLAQGGHVIGVIPEALVVKEVAHKDLSDLRVVGSMHLEHSISEGFVRSECRAMISVASSANELIDLLNAYEPPVVEKWIDRASA